MKIAFDVHGTLDTSPGLIVILMKMFEQSGNEVFLISGPPKDEIYNEIMKINTGYFHQKYDNIYSVVDFAKGEGVPMSQHKNGSWFCHDYYWWRSKGLICKRHAIDMIFDNELKYRQYMPPTTNFVHWNKRVFGELGS